MRIIVPLKPYSWNVLVRKHYRVVQKFKDEWHDAILGLIRAKGLPRLLSYPVTIYVEAHWKFKKRHDIDSLCTKFAIDALVKGGVLDDDDLTHVDKVVFTGKTGQLEDQLIIEIKNSP